MPQKKDRILTPEKRLDSFKEIYLGINRATAIVDSRIFLEREKFLKGEPCPLGTDHLALLRLIVQKDFKGAFKKLIEINPFAAFTGRLSQDPYFETQVFNQQGEKISLRSLERFLMERASCPLIKSDSQDQPAVAVIGSGPAGLMSAWTLSQKGYRVHIFEQEIHIGGSLFFYWPEFLVPKKIIQQLISLFQSVGIRFHVNQIFGVNVTYESLKELDFQAIVLATGAGVPRFSKKFFCEGGGVFEALSLLRLWTQERLIKSPQEVFFPIGKEVLIVAETLESLHLARILVRLKAQVTLVLSGDTEEIFQDSMLVQHAQEEGVLFQTYLQPLDVLKNDDGHFQALICQKLSPKTNPQMLLNIKKEENTIALKADSLILATSTEPNTLFFQPQKSLFLEEGRKGVFATGAVVRADMGFLQALLSGQKTAEDVDLFLKGHYGI